MAKFELKFKDCTDNSTIQAELDDSKEAIWIKSTNTRGYEIEIILDKSTAIKFAKTLRTEINKITESEVNNG